MIADQAQLPTTDPAITDGSAQRALDAARAKWKAKGTRSYSLVVRHQCFCAPPATRPYKVVVRGGRIVRASSYVRDFASVPRLFEIVQQAIAKKVVDLQVTYDRRRGFPREIFVDVSLQIADEEQGYGASRFKRL